MVRITPILQLMTVLFYYAFIIPLVSSFTPYRLEPNSTSELVATGNGKQAENSYISTAIIRVIRQSKRVTTRKPAPKTKVTTRKPTTTPKPLTIQEKIQLADRKVGSIAETDLDFQLTMSSNYNWETLLSPAPISISVLGSLMITSSITMDFSLEKGRPAEGYFSYMQYPQSFRATLVQISNTGYNAFLKAHTNMNKIKLYTQTIPSHVADATKILYSRNAVVIQKFLPGPISRISEASRQCVKLSGDVVSAFHHLLNLTMEVIAVSTATKGVSEMQNANVSRQMQITKIKISEQQKLVDKLDKDYQIRSAQLNKSLELYEEASNSFPSAASIFFMNLGDGISNMLQEVISLPLKIAAAPYKLSSSALDAAMTGDEDAENQPEEDGEPVKPQIPEYDLACIKKSQKSLNEIAALITIINAEALKKFEVFSQRTADFEDTIKTWESLLEKSKNLNQQQCESLVTTFTTTKEITEILRMLEHDKIRLSVQKKSKNKKSLHNSTADDQSVSSKESSGIVITSIEEEENRIQLETQRVVATIASLAKFLSEIKAYIALNKPVVKPASSGLVSSGGNGRGSKPSSSSQAINAAEKKLNSANEQLTYARASVEKVREQVIDATKSYMEYLTEMAALDIDKVRYDEIIAILTKGLNLMSQLKEHWDKLTRFFESISSIIDIILSKELDNFRNRTLEASDPQIFKNSHALQIIGELLFQSIVKANQASRFVNMIASLYVQVSENHIMDHIASLDRLSNADPMEANRLQNSLAKNCSEASEAIIELVTKQKEQMLHQLNERNNRIKEAYSFLLDKPSDNVGEITGQIESGETGEEGEEDEEAALDEHCAGQELDSCKEQLQSLQFQLENPNFIDIYQS